MSCTRLSIIALLVPGLLPTGAAAQSQQVLLNTAPLADPALVLSPSCLDPRQPDRPIVCYAAYGAEVLLPRGRAVLGPQTPSPTLVLGGRTYTLAQTADGLQLTRSGRAIGLKCAGLGCAPLAGLLPGDPEALVAFPRAFTFHDATTLFYRSGSVKIGKLGKTPIVLYDDNLDGAYAKGSDGLCVGDPGKVGIFAPLGDVIPTPDGAYRVAELAADGSAMTARPYDGPTGRLKVEMAGDDLECRIALASGDGKCSFAMLADGAALVVPAGTYRVLYGLIYRPLGKQAAAVIPPGKDRPIRVGKDQEIGMVVGESLEQTLEGAEQVMTTPIDALLELDLAPVVATCDREDFAEAQKLFAGVTARHPGGPNVEATQAWLAEVGQRLRLEASPEAAAFRRARSRLLAAVSKGDRAAAASLLPAAAAAFAKIPAQFAAYPAYRVRKAQAEALARFCKASAPGLKETGRNWGKHQVGAQVTDKIDWQGPRFGQTQFFFCNYEGFLVVPEDGEYELALASDQAGRLSLDEQLLIDHWKSHDLSEKTVRVTLKAGPHPLSVEMFNALGRGGLHLRWTPPGGRKAIIPPWALEHQR
jgi:hypothetical protein